MTSMYSVYSKHLMLDLWGCDERILKDRSILVTTLFAAAKEAGAEVVGRTDYKFGGEGGIAMALLLAESHISIHTWPEHNHAQVDIYTCGDCQPIKGAQVVFERLGATTAEVNLFSRPDVCLIDTQHWNSGMGNDHG